MSQHTFFNITVPAGQSDRDWAHRFWDTYGFDYDLERTGSGVVLAWALDDDGEEALKRALKEDDIEFSEFEVENLDAFFGIDKNS